MAILPSPFPTTHWTVIRETRTTDPAAAAAALELLCQQYRAPILAFIKSTDLSEEDAEDAVQEFFYRFISSGGFSKIEEKSGRARSYILKSVTHFLIDQERFVTAGKRDYKKTYSLNETSSSEQPTVSPQIFDREWARTVMEEALKGVHLFLEGSGKGELYEPLYGIVEGYNDLPERKREICEEFKLSLNHLNVLTCRFQDRLALEIRKVISHTVSDDKQVAEELDYLRSIWTEEMKDSHGS